jgi:hypothetical protein
VSFFPQSCLRFRGLILLFVCVRVFVGTRPLSLYSAERLLNNDKKVCDCVVSFCLGFSLLFSVRLRTLFSLDVFHFLFVGSYPLLLLATLCVCVCVCERGKYASKAEAVVELYRQSASVLSHDPFSPLLTIEWGFLLFFDLILLAFLFFSRSLR